MAKVVFKKLTGPRALAERPGADAVHKTKWNGPDGAGELVTIRTSSDTFDEALAYAFARNVARARRENKRLTGQADRAPAKG